MSFDATKYAEDFILSIVIGKDMIARYSAVMSFGRTFHIISYYIILYYTISSRYRMSLNNLKDLRDRVMFLVSKTRKPKVYHQY